MIPATSPLKTGGELRRGAPEYSPNWERSVNTHSRGILVTSEQAHLHLIGVGGSGMLPLALLLRQAGHLVTGSDNLCPPERLAMLQAQGVEAFPGTAPARVKRADCVVVSPAIPETHVERLAARREGIPVETRAQVLAR